MAARQGESFSSAWEADLGGTPWNAVGVLNGVYRFMTCLKRRARNCPFSRSRYLYPAISSISINGRVRSTVRRFIASHFSPLLYNSTVGATFEIESCCFGTFFEINSVFRNRSYVFLKRVIILTILETNESLDVPFLLLSRRVESRYQAINIAAATLRAKGRKRRGRWPR